jgi:hypothetical protein
MQSDLLFSLLLVGLEKYTKASTLYPFPAELQHAMNGLAAKMGQDYPKSRRDFMTLMTKPLHDWWIPYGGAEIEGFDSRFSLMYRDETYGDELSDPSVEFLIEGNLRGVNIAELLTLQDNGIMRRFVEHMRGAYQTSRDDDEATQIERDYAAVRAFIVENAFIYPQDVRRQVPYHLQATVLDMYIPVAQQSSRLLYNGSYWHCRECGMIYVDHERRRQGLKPDVCAVRCPGQAGWAEISADPNLLILRPGIQRRTLIPGRVEIELYHWLADEIRPQKPQLVEVRVYPGVDRYDLRLLFSDEEAWAVDVKDYHAPAELGAHIARSPKPYDMDNRLRWDRAFYVVPDDREKGGYCSIVWQEAGLANYPSVALRTMRAFKEEVMTKIWELEE